MTNEKKAGNNTGKWKDEKGSSNSNGDVHVGSGGELHQVAGGNHPVLTTNQGIPVSDNQNSLRTNVRGPTLLEDFVLREKITHFDHERTPSVMFDAIAIILSSDGAKLLTRESAAIDFVHNAFGHLKAIAVDKGGQELLQKANIERDKGVVDLIDIAGFISAAKTRQWDREPSVRILA